MQQRADTRLARATANAPRNLAAARHRSLLRARVALAALLREGSSSPDGGQALAGVLQSGDRAAVELAGIPDEPELRETDMALLANDRAGAEETFEARLRRLVRGYREGEIDQRNASPADLLAAYVAKAAMPPPPISPAVGGGLGRAELG
jgi:hypothetical protein